MFQIVLVSCVVVSVHMFSKQAINIIVYSANVTTVINNVKHAKSYAYSKLYYVYLKLRFKRFNHHQMIEIHSIRHGTPLDQSSNLA